jgi:hypothetical protein
MLFSDRFSLAFLAGMVYAYLLMGCMKLVHQGLEAFQSYM